MKRLTWTLAVLFSVSLLFGFAGVSQAAEGEEDSDPQKYLDRMEAEARLRMEHKRKLAEHYFETGKARYEERRYADAEEDFASALEANPHHEQAREYLAKVRRILGKTPSGDRDILPLELTHQGVQLGYQKARMLRATTEGRQFLREADHAEALAKLDEARNLAKVLAARLDVSGELAEIEALIAEAEAGRDTAAKEAGIRKLERAHDLARAEHERLQELHQQRIDRLFDDARRLYEETRYLLAAKKAEEILKLDPRNEEVEAFRDKCYAMRVAKDEKWYERTTRLETAAAWRHSRHLAIPFTSVAPVYPADWEEVLKRTAGIQIETEGGEQPPWLPGLKKKLEEEVSFDFIATPLEDVVAFLRNLKDVNIVIDRKAIQAHQGDVTLRLDNVKMKDALGWILRLLDLSYTLENNAVYISTKESISQSRKTVTRFYDVTDLTIEIRDFKPNLQAISNSDVLDGDSFEDIFAEEDEGGAEDEGFTGDSLVEFIMSVIAPGTWETIDTGDDFGI